MYVQSPSCTVGHLVEPGPVPSHASISCICFSLHDAKCTFQTPLLH